jgi:nitrate/nitrite transporter NarK
MFGIIITFIVNYFVWLLLALLYAQLNPLTDLGRKSSTSSADITKPNKEP